MNRANAAGAKMLKDRLGHEDKPRHPVGTRGTYSSCQAQYGITPLSETFTLPVALWKLPLKCSSPWASMV